MRIISFGLIGVALVAGCNVFTSPDQSVMLSVEKIDAPATSPVGAPLTVVLTVIMNGCQSFDHLEAKSAASGASLTAWGVDATIGNKNVVCPSILKSEPHSYEFTPPTRGTFGITVDQGRMPPLTATVQVQ
jgi:hypothetical protein